MGILSKPNTTEGKAFVGEYRLIFQVNGWFLHSQLKYPVPETNNEGSYLIPHNGRDKTCNQTILFKSLTSCDKDAMKSCLLMKMIIPSITKWLSMITPTSAFREVMRKVPWLWSSHIPIRIRTLQCQTYCCFLKL